jgi:hypothetical protein
MKKQKHEYSWLVDRIKAIHPFVEVSNNHQGGYLVFSISNIEMGGQGVMYTEQHFLKAVRYARKNKQFTNQSK